MSRTIAAAIIALLLVGCSGKSADSPVSPDPSTTRPQTSQSFVSDNRYLLGYWDFFVSEDLQSVEIVPRRLAELHLNAVKFLEVSPCTDCLQLYSAKVVPQKILRLTLVLKHPFPGNNKLTGFDVRGIFITGADYSFPVSGHSIAWGPGLPKLINHDGYTGLFNPTQFPENGSVPPILKYYTGKLAHGANLTATLNPFFAFRDGESRRIFKADTQAVQDKLQILVPGGAFSFGYAVDLSWMHVDGEITNPVYDFPPEANSLEAYRIKVLPLEHELNADAGYSSQIGVIVSDHQGQETISKVTIEAPDLFDGETELSYAGEPCDDGWLYTGIISNSLGADYGTYPLLVKVVDTAQDENFGAIKAYYVHEVGVDRNGWVRNFGECALIYAADLDLDTNGNIYATGFFENDGDFDPGPEVDEKEAYSGTGFISKYGADGEYLDTRIFSGNDYVISCGLSVDGAGNQYIAGYFQGEADFDPGSGVDNHTSNGGYDMFLMKLDQSDNFLWARTWGGSDWDKAYQVKVDNSGNLYVTGEFTGIVDFDPGAGVDEETAQFGQDACLVKYNASGEYQYALTWGGNGDDSARGIAFDGSGNVFVTGWLNATVDLDPGPGEFIASGGGSHISIFNTQGEFQSALFWQGTTYTSFVYAHRIEFDSSWNLYVAGSYNGDVDLDPGPGEDIHFAPPYYQAFLLKFDSSCNYLWGNGWGNDWDTSGLDVVVDNSGKPYLLGSYFGTIDFDPGPGVYELTSQWDIELWPFNSLFVVGLDSDGNFQWVKMFGLSDTFGTAEMVTDGDSALYVLGTCDQWSDYDPGPGIEQYESMAWDGVLYKIGLNGTW
jgi:hypothetical protein